MRGEHSVNKYAYPKYSVAIDLTSEDYEAPDDGQGVPIPFQLNCAEGGLVKVKLVDSDAFVEQYFNTGDNPSLVIAVDDASTMTTGLVALYPYKPATTTINTTY